MSVHPLPVVFDRSRDSQVLLSMKLPYVTPDLGETRYMAPPTNGAAER